MTSTIIIIFGLSILGLISYLIYLNKKSKADDEDFDINENPEFLRLQGQHEANLKEIELKEKFIEELKNDKQALRDSVKSVDEFEKISTESFKNYSTLVTEYRDFHEKLVGNFKYQGQYNEKKIQRLFEKHGLVEGDDFTTREAKSNIDPATGLQRKVVPDFVINLPGDNASSSIVVDCKVSLTNFQKFANEKDKKEREIFLKKHIDSVKDHVEKLSTKDYIKIHNLKSFQYVVLFMPFDSCYLSVLEHDDSILDYCHERKVILAGPISLMGLIKTVTSLKNQQKQLSIVDKIVGDAEGIYDKYKAVKDNLRTAISSYKTHSKSLQNLINNTYGSSRGLESKIKKLKDDHGLSPGQSIKESTDDEKIIMELDDPEEKKVINYKN